jgi:hypothetical protein
MKKFFYLIVLTIAVVATSCESHEDDNKFSEKIGLSQLYSVTMGNKTTLYKPVMFTYELNYNEGTADITINGVQFSPMMPAITMEIEDIRFTKSISGIKLNATNIVPEVDDKPIPEYTISSLNCRIASSQILNFSIAELSFVVNNSITVNVSSPTLTFEHESQTDVRKVYSSNSNDDFHFNNASYAIYLNPDNNLAQVYVFNMKFAEKMPAMNMIFPNVTYTATPSGFELTCDELIPTLNNTEKTPVASYPISAFNAKVANGLLTINFNCTKVGDEAMADRCFSVNSEAYMFAKEKLQ